MGAPEEAMVDSPLETLLKRIIEKEAPTAAPAATPRIQIKKEPSGVKIKKEPVAGPSGVKIKKESPSIKPPIPPKPSTSSKSTGGVKKAAPSGGAKVLLKKIGVDPKFIGDDESDKDEGYSPKKKTEKVCQRLTE